MFSAEAPTAGYIHIAVSCLATLLTPRASQSHIFLFRNKNESTGGRAADYSGPKRIIQTLFTDYSAVDARRRLVAASGYIYSIIHNYSVDLLKQARYFSKNHELLQSTEKPDPP